MQKWQNYMQSNQHRFWNTKINALTKKQPSSVNECRQQDTIHQTLALTIVTSAAGRVHPNIQVTEKSLSKTVASAPLQNVYSTT